MTDFAGLDAQAELEIRPSVGPAVHKITALFEPIEMRADAIVREAAPGTKVWRLGDDVRTHALCEHELTQTLAGGGRKPTFSLNRISAFRRVTLSCVDNGKIKRGIAFLLADGRLDDDALEPDFQRDPFDCSVARAHFDMVQPSEAGSPSKAIGLGCSQARFQS